MSSSNNFTITGKFLGAMPVKTLDNGKNVTSFFLDVTDNPEYPSTPEFGLYDTKCELIQGLEKGEEIEVRFNISGKKYKNSTTGKSGVFTALQCWKIEKVAQQQPAPAQPAQNGGGIDDDLPF